MKVKKYKPGMKLEGFILDMPNDVYHASAGISKSGLDLISRSPAHYFLAPTKEPTRNMILGSATHSAILEPEKFASDYLLLRDIKDRRASAYKEAIKAHNPDYVLTEPEADRVTGMQESISTNSLLKSLIDEIKYTEVSLFLNRNGVTYKCRFDAITKNGSILDLKTTQDARFEAFSRSIFNYRYHVQAAYYSDLFEAAAGAQADFIFLAVESEPPHASKVYRLDSISMEIGREAYKNDLEVYKQCFKSNLWPAYEQNNEPDLIALPEWAIMDYESDADLMI